MPIGPVYVGLTSGTVQRLVLPQLTTDIRITLGTSLYPADVRVAPGAPHTVAIAKCSTSDAPFAKKLDFSKAVDPKAVFLAGTSSVPNNLPLSPFQ